MASLVELLNIHGHRIYANTSLIRRIEPKGEDPDTTMIVLGGGGENGDFFFEVLGKVEDIAEMLNERMR